MNTVLISLASLVIGLLYILWFRYKDVHEPEPVVYMLLSFAIGGVLSIVISSIIYLVVPVSMDFYGAFLVGFVEELGKLLAFLAILPFIKNQMDELVDGLIYMGCVALGFAVIENVFYAMNSPSPYSLLGLRAVTSTIGHISFSAYMGVAFVIHFREDRNYWGIFWGFIFAMVTHGLYDAVLFETHLNHYFGFVYITGAIIQYNILLLLLSYSKYRPPFDERFFNKHFSGEAITCLNCGNIKGNTEYIFKRIKMVKCPECHLNTMDKYSTKRVFNYYRPLFDIRVVMRGDRNKSSFHFSPRLKIFYNRKKQYFAFSLSEVKKWFFESNIEDRDHMLLKKLYAPFLNLLGFNKIRKREFIE